MINLWEISLCIIAVTFMVVNIASLWMSLVLMYKFGGIATRSARMIEKMMNKYEKEIDDFSKE